ncbi:hypothetical protein ACIHFC_24570 [Streptomyces sp. NPDC052013]|uniref:hypothetical protein n=1 Tax=Streptomyces sp. NPDC052013 TaxID=3365679 RepID=UPI0037D83BF7
MRRFRKTLITAVLAALLVGSTAGWAPSGGDGLPSGPLPGTAAGLADESGQGAAGSRHGHPVRSGGALRRLTDAQQRRLVEDHPTVVGNLDGVSDSPHRCVTAVRAAAVSPAARTPHRSATCGYPHPPRAGCPPVGRVMAPWPAGPVDP